MPRGDARRWSAGGDPTTTARRDPLFGDPASAGTALGTGAAVMRGELRVLLGEPPRGEVGGGYGVTVASQTYSAAAALPWSAFVASAESVTVNL